MSSAPAATCGHPAPRRLPHRLACPPALRRFETLRSRGPAACDALAACDAVLSTRRPRRPGTANDNHDPCSAPGRWGRSGGTCSRPPETRCRRGCGAARWRPRVCRCSALRRRRRSARAAPPGTCGATSTCAGRGRGRGWGWAWTPGRGRGERVGGGREREGQRHRGEIARSRPGAASRVAGASERPRPGRRAAAAAPQRRAARSYQGRPLSSLPT